MSPLAEFDQQLERMIREFAMRIAVPRWSEFDRVWEAAMRVCDRYQLGKSGQSPLNSQSSSPSEQQPVISSVEPSATDEPVQTHPPIAA
jgi:hypothetical protein